VNLKLKKQVIDEQVFILALQPAYVDAQTQNAPSPRRTQHETQNEQMNAWTVDLAGGLLQEKGWTYVKT